jgi:Mn2+/Fe2+ NRAMP family transporter
MTDRAPPEGLEPIDAVTITGLPPKPRPIRASLRLTIHGRSVTLRGLRRPPTGLMRWLLILGPGLVATSAGNDAGGIATYSAAGAQYGYDLIWVMVLLTVSLAVIQEMSSRLGAATGRGLLDLIRERFGIGWALLAVATVLAANGGLVITEFVGIGAAAELFGVSRYLVIPLAAALIWYLVLFTAYQPLERVFIVMTLVFFAYPVAAVMARPDWGQVARGALVPTLRPDAGYLFLLVGLLGTTITPFMQVFQQSSMVERGVARRHYGLERWDAYFGALFSNLMSITMIIATATTLHAAGQTRLESAADAARALEPFLGSAARLLFSVGLLGASLLTAAVLPLATAYAVTEVLGVPKGVNLDFRRARIFFGLFTAILVLGAGVALIPRLPVIPLLLIVQVLNGALLPIVLFLMLRLGNDKNLMGELKNSRLTNAIAWVSLVVISLAVAAMLASQVWGWLR